MSDSQSIFDANGQAPSGTPSNTANVAAAPNNDAMANLLASIKNERGEPKYKSVEAALEALAHSQNYIPQLKNELDNKERELLSVQESLSKMSSMEEAIQRLTQKQSDPNTPGQQMSDEDIAKIVERKLEASRQMETTRGNQRKVADALVKQFGNEKANEVFYSKAQELGFSADEINALAGKSPEAVLRLVGVSGASANKQDYTLPTGTFRSDTFKNNASTLVGRETTKLQLGATTQDHQGLMQNARDMVDELHSQGLGVDFLTDPKNFFKYMK